MLINFEVNQGTQTEKIILNTRHLQNIRLTSTGLTITMLESVLHYAVGDDNDAANLASMYESIVECIFDDENDANEHDDANEDDECEYGEDDENEEYDEDDESPFSPSSAY